MRFLKVTSVIFFFFAVSIAEAVVVLSEVMFDPAGEESSDEFLELFNNSALPVQLAGWTISDGEAEDTLVSAGQGLLAPPNQYVLIIDPDYVEDGSMTYDGLVPESALIVTIDNGSFGSRGLSNSANETITVRNAGGSVVAEYRYSVGNTPGHSDEKIRFSGSDDSTNWSNSVTLHGTPGFRNSVTPPERDLAIVEILPTPEYPAPQSNYLLDIVVVNMGLQSASGSIALSADSTGGGNAYLLATYSTGLITAGDSTAISDSLTMPETGIHYLICDLSPLDDDTSNNRLSAIVSSEVTSIGIRINEIQYAPLTGRAEWCELSVAGTIPVSTRGMSISDGQGLADTSKRVVLPELLLLPGQFLVVSSDSIVFSEGIPIESPVAVVDLSTFTLNNSGDSLVIYSPSGEVIERVDYRSNWGGSEDGISLERVSLSASSNDPANWGSCRDGQGSTPGRVNSRTIPARDSGTSLSVYPTAFTPNGDGIDDVLEIQYEIPNSTGEISIKIFDVRGRLVRRIGGGSQSVSGSVLWDGRKDNGTLSATARYVILLEAEDAKGGVVRERTTAVLARPK